MFAILLIISLRNPCVVTCHRDISINNGHLYNGSRNRKILSLSDILTPWHKARFLWCDDAGVKPTALPSLRKYSTYHYVQYITLDGDKPPWYWFMYLLYYAFYHYFWMYSFDLQKKNESLLQMGWRVMLAANSYIVCSSHLLLHHFF